MIADGTTMKHRGKLLAVAAAVVYLIGEVLVRAKYDARRAASERLHIYEEMQEE